MVFPSVLSFSIRKVLTWRLTRKRRGLWGTDDDADGTLQKSFYLVVKDDIREKSLAGDKVPAFRSGRGAKILEKAKPQRTGPNTYATVISNGRGYNIDHFRRRHRNLDADGCYQYWSFSPFPSFSAPLKNAKSPLERKQTIGIGIFHVALLNLRPC